MHINYSHTHTHTHTHTHGSGQVLWTCTGRNKTLPPSASLPVMGEIVLSTWHHWADIFIVRRKRPDGQKGSVVNSTAACSTWKLHGLVLGPPIRATRAYTAHNRLLIPLNSTAQKYRVREIHPSTLRIHFLSLHHAYKLLMQEKKLHKKIITNGTKE